MNQNSSAALGQISRFGVGGAFGGMVFIGTILWWDVSGIGSMMTAAEETIRLNLFLAGAMLKGALLGAVLGAAMPRKQPSAVRATAGTRFVGAAKA
jgi:hypothetical protein